MSEIELLLDQNLTPRLVHELANAGVSARHVLAIGFESASDESILQHAAKMDWVIVTADSDFGKLHARLGSVRPSILLLRHDQPLILAPLAIQISLLLTNAEERIRKGALVTLDENSVRLRDLPLQ